MPWLHLIFDAWEDYRKTREREAAEREALEEAFRTPEIFDDDGYETKKDKKNKKDKKHKHKHKKDKHGQARSERRRGGLILKPPPFAVRNGFLARPART